jgi:hypothetical protein
MSITPVVLRSAGSGAIAAAHSGAGATEAASISKRGTVNRHERPQVHRGVVKFWIKCAEYTWNGSLAIKTRKDDRISAPTQASALRYTILALFQLTHDMDMYYAENLRNQLHQDCDGRAMFSCPDQKALRPTIAVNM